MEVKLAEIAQKLGKTATDIARETGINRNTVNALMKGRVSDIRISTLKKISVTYGISILDLLGEDDSPQKDVGKNKDLPHKFYKQEAEVVPFTSWPWIAKAGNFSISHHGRDVGFGRMDCYCKKDYGFAYWDHEAFEDLAEIFYEMYGERREQYAKLYSKYSIHASEIEDIYLSIHDRHVEATNVTELKNIFKKLQAAYSGFWDNSLFIDAFDTGVDHEHIDAIAKQYGLDKREVGILTTPVEMTFADERRYTFLSLLKSFHGKAEVRVEAFMRKNHDALDAYRKKFDFYKSNYLDIKHITSQEIEAEAKKYLEDPELLKKDYMRLERYTDTKQAEIHAVLKSRHLKENPLWFFGDITFLREHRKKVNLMGIHVLDFILSVIEEKTGVPKKFLRYLTFDEVDNMLKGLIPISTLERRYRDGILITMDENGYKIFEGAEADSIRNDIETAIAGGNKGSGAEGRVITGQTASQGYAKGIARIILTQEDFHKFKAGEILVTSMTRPEFVPLMKIAAAIVTNEGGITCHAAIVSRELGKPCVIATKIATQVIKDGDVVEVRANHGTVRVLK